MERDEKFPTINTIFDISTHTLTWSVTSETDRYDEAKNFNSHAHVERDLTDYTALLIWIISTHTLTWSVTDFPSSP